jgi:hypothetical protein
MVNRLASRWHGPNVGGRRILLGSEKKNMRSKRMTDSPMYVDQAIEDEEDTYQGDEENPSNIHETVL